MGPCRFYPKVFLERCLTINGAFFLVAVNVKQYTLLEMVQGFADHFVRDILRRPIANER